MDIKLLDGIMKKICQFLQNKNYKLMQTKKAFSTESLMKELDDPTTTSGTELKRVSLSPKYRLSYIVSGAGLAAGIGGIFYAHKKGYGGWGKFGMFILFSIPFTITAGAIRMSDKITVNSVM